MADHKVVQNRKSNVKKKERGGLSVKREPRPGEITLQITLPMFLSKIKQSQRVVGVGMEVKQIFCIVDPLLTWCLKHLYCYSIVQSLIFV